MATKRKKAGAVVRRRARSALSALDVERLLIGNGAMFVLGAASELRSSKDKNEPLLPHSDFLGVAGTYGGLALLGGMFMKGKARKALVTIGEAGFNAQAFIWGKNSLRKKEQRIKGAEDYLEEIDPLDLEEINGIGAPAPALPVGSPVMVDEFGVPFVVSETM